MRPKKTSKQLSLFRPEKNRVSLEEYKKMVTKKPKKRESKLMKDVMKLAAYYDLPSIHIKYYCGNKFFPTCSGTKTNKHKEARLICPVCHKEKLATCTNKINKNLAGHYDIIGISWAIETKHKTNKYKKQKIKLSTSQNTRKQIYQALNFPHIEADEDRLSDVIQFLADLKKKRIPFPAACKTCQLNSCGYKYKSDKCFSNLYKLQEGI